VARTPWNEGEDGRFLRLRRRAATARPRIARVEVAQRAESAAPLLAAYVAVELTIVQSDMNAVSGTDRDDAAENRRPIGVPAHGVAPGEYRERAQVFEPSRKRRQA
jgi:hypothetical protein